MRTLRRWVSIEIEVDAETMEQARVVAAELKVLPANILADAIDRQALAKHVVERVAVMADRVRRDHARTETH